MGSDDKSNKALGDGHGSRRERMALVLGECSDQLNAGEPLDIDEVLRNTPTFSRSCGKPWRASGTCPRQRRPSLLSKHLGTTAFFARLAAAVWG